MSNVVAHGETAGLLYIVTLLIADLDQHGHVDARDLCDRLTKVAGSSPVGPELQRMVETISAFIKGPTRPTLGLVPGGKPDPETP